MENQIFTDLAQAPCEPTPCTHCPYARALKAFLFPKSYLERPKAASAEHTRSSTLSNPDKLQNALTPSSVILSEAFEIYIGEIALNDQRGKSPAQRQQWENIKRCALTNFLRVVPDKPVFQVDRNDALAFYRWQMRRISPEMPPSKRCKPCTARRELGNMRKFFRQYFTYIGEENHPNPFRGLSIQDGYYESRPAFENDWVVSKILKPRVFKGIRADAVIALYTLIETGCRASEVLNLQPEDIRLEADVPYIRIRASHERQLKTKSSIRTIPLVGVSQAAMRKATNGFPHYQDRSHLFSKSMMRAFRRRGLFPSDDHTIYSFRHSFEKRMQEAGLDYGLRCTLMGHDTKGPTYGDGGSLAYRRDELLKIAHPFPQKLFDGIEPIPA